MYVAPTSGPTADSRSPVLAGIHRGQECSTRCFHLPVFEAVGHSGWVPPASTVRKRTITQVVNILSKFIPAH